MFQCKDDVHRASTLEKLQAIKEKIQIEKMTKIRRARLRRRERYLEKECLAKMGSTLEVTKKGQDVIAAAEHEAVSAISQLRDGRQVVSGSGLNGAMKILEDCQYVPGSNTCTILWICYHAV